MYLGTDRLRCLIVREDQLTLKEINQVKSEGTVCFGRRVSNDKRVRKKVSIINGGVKIWYLMYITIIYRGQISVSSFDKLPFFL